MITCEGKHLLTAKEKEHFEGMIHIMKRIGSINKKILLHEDVSKAEFFTLMSIHRDRFGDLLSENAGMASGLNVSELATQLNISVPAVSKMIRRLEEKGYIVRIPGTSDRRMISLGLTEYGQELIETTIRHMSSMTMEIVQQLGEEDSRTLMHLLNHVFDIIDHMLESEHPDKEEIE